MNQNQNYYEKYDYEGGEQNGLNLGDIDLKMNKISPSGDYLHIADLIYKYENVIVNKAHQNKTAVDMLWSKIQINISNVSVKEDFK